ncbi:hypothetical protein [Cellulosimicrobium cellulans]|nr:hypothetical protein [Cellulosimicrobium cellulans]QUB99193.1 hypothetical protein J5A69_15970 [Cellulosimicrobium cellulans]
MVATCFTWNMGGTTWPLNGSATASKQTVDAKLLMRWQRPSSVEAE